MLEVNPDFSCDEIEYYLEDILKEFLKERILKLKIPSYITLEKLRRQRTGLYLKQKSGRWERKIDSLIKKFERNKNYFKLKELQDNLKKLNLKSEYNYYTIGNGISHFRYQDRTFIEFNGNKEVNTQLQYKSQKIDYADIDPKTIKPFNIVSESYEKVKTELTSDFSLYEDYLKEIDKLNRHKVENGEEKIPIEPSLLQRINSIKLEPMKKKNPEKIDIIEFKKQLDELDSFE